MESNRKALLEQIGDLQQQIAGLQRMIPLAENYADETRGKQALEHLNAELQRSAAQLVALDAARQQSEEQHQANVLMEQVRVAMDDVAFWLRRLCTTVGIGNAAAFAAVASGFLQADDRAPVAKPVADAMAFFSAGMMRAGAMPVFLLLMAMGRRAVLLRQVEWQEPEHWLDTLLFLALMASGVASAFCLVKGFGFAIGGVRGLVPH